MRSLPLVLAALLFGLARALAPGPGVWVDPLATVGLDAVEPPPGPAAKALAGAHAERRALVGAPAAARPALRRRAVEAALQVVTAFPDEPEAVEAAFRAGELRRAAGDAAGALSAFRRAAELGIGTTLGARATYEAAHVLRREGRWLEALTSYERVHHDAAATAARRDLAGLWLARARLELDQADEAERLLRRLASDVRDPLSRVRVHDLLIELLVARGELAAAVGWLDACKRAVHAVSLEQTRRGARVRGELEDMRALALLREAIEARHVVSR